MSESDFTMEKTYNPQAIEQAHYRAWEESGAFKPVMRPGRKPFTIVMPPPNITGQLHMGHAMDCVMQDSLARYHRMRGDPTLWLPGTDHASIATEVKVVEKMAQEGLTKESLGREGFLRRAWAWKEEFGGRITSQLRRMGASCDWSRERFTMDEGCSRAVREVFVRLYEQGLIYRGERMVNWCSDCGTAISDIEVEYEDQDSHLWYIRYPQEDGGEGLVVATTRPETMLGDTGVAVNPEDPRYSHLKGARLRLPLTDRVIPVVADSYVDPAFGTGAVKMTPAHDPNDLEVAQRQGLEIMSVTTLDGRMNEAAGPRYQGLTQEDCRKLVVEDLKAQGLLVKVEPYRHSVGTCSRCHHTVEPLISLQWFVRMEPLARPAIEAVRRGETRFIPDRFSRIYYNWMENIRDWCVSRQLWWGHRIPAWYCDSCGKTFVLREDPERCPDCGGALRQDEDVLDTWFSSALWPFSTLGWPEDTEDLRAFYPTSTLVTGYDIIFFWVARMIFSGIAHTGQVPFDTVLIHGLVRDALGRKMSKSLNNGIDPLEVIDRYGADALRFSLCQGVSAGADSRFSDEKAEAARNFANKIWNAARFVLMNLEGEEAIDASRLGAADKWILSRLNLAIREVTGHFEQHELGLAAQKLYDFVWSEFCDWYIELAKGALYGEEAGQRQVARAVLQHVLSAALRLLHPFMPFLTEEVYAYLPGMAGKSCMLAEWPDALAEHDFPEDERAMEGVMQIIRSVRALRADMKVQPGARARLLLRPQPGWERTLLGAEGHFQRLAGVSRLSLLREDEQVAEKTVGIACPAASLLIPLGELVDLDKERTRLKKERDGLAQEIGRSEQKLNNPGFLKKAPEHLVEEERQKLADRRAMLEATEQRLKDLDA